MTKYKICQIMYKLLEMPKHKIEYVINQVSLVEGLWANLHAYDIPYTKENHKLLIDSVQDLLENSNFEREWTEQEYTNFVKYEEI